MSINKPGGHAGITDDAKSLPYGVSGVKTNSPQNVNAPVPGADGHMEQIVKIIPKGAFQRLVISSVGVPNGKRYASIRTFLSEGGQNFAPSKKGIMIQRAHLAEVIDALQAVLR